MPNLEKGEEDMHHSNQKEFEGTTLARTTVKNKNWNQALLMPLGALWGYFSDTTLVSGSSPESGSFPLFEASWAVTESSIGATGSLPGL